LSAERRAPRADVALGAVLLSLLASCAHAPELPSVRSRGAAFAIPKDPAGAIPWEPTQVEGKVLAVIFVASWCFPCLTELGVMEGMQRDLGPKGLVTVAVGMDLEGHKVLDPFTQATVNGLPVVVADEALRKGDSPFGPIKELPTRFLFARDGTLLKAWSGASDPAKLRQLLQAALDDKQ
jgi:thiol-disulfide isomerase/thioredoxin